MKKLFIYLLSAIMIVAMGCSESYDDSKLWEEISSIKNRLTELEQLCKQMNTNIEALQTLVAALEQRDYITNVSEVRSNGEVIGYTISFSKNNTITIYHGQDGQDGQDGANGKDGYIPQIGVMEDTDGIYYWTLDGEWLLDAKGNKIKAVATDGKDGHDGINGTDGQDGKDGVMPQLKIENNYWYVSYDNGATWVQLGKATGEDGKDGTDGEDGDSIFNSVTQDDENVYFNLADGTTITLPKHDVENIQFEDLQVKAICCRNWDTNNDGELSYAEAAAVTDIGEEFRENTNIIAFTELKYFTGISEIPDKAFYRCGYLWKVVLPENITTIGYDSFYYCDDLTSVTIGNSVTSIGDRAFFECSNLASVTIGNSVTSIGSYTFAYCSSLTSVTIGNGVTSIGDSAFYGCSSLANVTIPNSVTSIGESAFRGCSSLANVTIPNSVTSIGDSAFLGCSSLASVTIPDSVTSIGDSAFEYCNSLTSVTIPDSVTSIGASAFSDCSSLAEFKGKFASEDGRYLIVNGVLNSFAPAGLTEYSIPDSVTSIGSHAFLGCSSLVNVTIPDSVTSIGVGAFYNCTGELIIDSQTLVGRNYRSSNYPANSSSGWLYGNKFTKLTFGDSVTSIGSRAFLGCSSLASVTIPDSVISIGDDAFYDCSSLASVTIPDSVTSIGRYTFAYCSSLTSVTIGNGVTSIGDRAFYECSSLASVTIGNSVTSIGDSAFECCNSLTSVTIPDSVTSIGDRAFFECSNLASVTIGNSVTSIGDNAFYGCSSLASVYCNPATPPTGGGYMFHNGYYSIACTIYVPTASLDAYKTATGWKQYASYIVGYKFE